MTEFVLLTNRRRSSCRACGQIHPFFSNNEDGIMPCDTPCVFTREMADNLDVMGDPVPLPTGEEIAR